MTMEECARRRGVRDRARTNEQLTKHAASRITQHETSNRRCETALAAKMKNLSQQHAAMKVYATGKLARQVQRLQERRDAVVAAIDAMEANTVDPVAPGRSLMRDLN